MTHGLQNERRKPIEISSMDTVLLWEALRNLFCESQSDPVKQKEIRILLSKLGWKG